MEKLFSHKIILSAVIFLISFITYKIVGFEVAVLIILSDIGADIVLKSVKKMEGK